MNLLPLKTVIVVGCKGYGPGQFDGPTGVAVSKAGDIFVADFSNYRVQVFDIAGQYKRRFTIDYEGGRGRVQPLDVAFDKDDNLVIVDFFTKQICVCETDGRLLRWFGGAQLKHPRLLAVSSDGHVHVTDWSENCVKTFSPEGRLVGTIGCGGRLPGQFNDVHSVAINSKDQIIVSDSRNHRVQVFDSIGTFLLMCGMQAEGAFMWRMLLAKGDDKGQLQIPHGVTVDQYYNIIVCDWTNDCIQMFSLEGDYIGRVDDPSDGVKWPQAITTVPGQPLKLIVTEFNSDKNHMKLRIM